MIDDRLSELVRTLALQCRQRERRLRRWNIYLLAFCSISIGVSSGLIGFLTAFGWHWWDWPIVAANAYSALDCLHCWGENRRRIAESRRIAGAFEGIRAAAAVAWASPVKLAHHFDQAQAAFRDLERLLLK